MKKSYAKIPLWVILWAIAPWLFYAIYSFHKFDHADPFWLPAIPIVLISFIPMLFASGKIIGFPLAWVVGSSAFNLTVGFLSVSFLRWFQKGKAGKKEPNQSLEPTAPSGRGSP